MMNTSNIKCEDLSTQDIARTDYDLIILSSGYEERASYFVSRYHQGLNIDPQKVLIFKFNTHTNNPYREENDAYLKSLFGNEGVLMGDNFMDILTVEFNQRLSNLGKDCTFRILIDYSVMTRDWYAALLNICKAKSNLVKISIDFVYSYGRHVDLSSNSIISSYSCLNGCEGSVSKNGETIALIGLGFDSVPPIAIVEQLEPDKIFAFIADPAVIDDYAEKALNCNSKFIEEHIGSEDKVLRLPVNSIAVAYMNLYEFVFPFQDKNNITIVPFGPKPLVLASIILAMNLREVSLLYAKLERSTSDGPPSSVPATGGLAMTRITFDQIRIM